MKKVIPGALAAAWLLTSVCASADTFPAGSLIIPMDTTYQDQGMLKAYGLVYDLLRNNIAVHWVIKKGKQPGEADVTASATDRATGASISSHGYRAGPWVVGASDAAAAATVVDAWQSKHVTTVHIATEAFTGDVARRLIIAPTIAMFADGNQDIARSYVMAAGIPDSVLDPTWPDSSPDMLSVQDMTGATTTNHHDGALFDGDGDPVYCQLMSMHWAVKDARANPEVVAEVRSFLNHPVHFFAECQAVNAFENDLVNGLFLTRSGFDIDVRPNAVDSYNFDSPFAQFDGAFETIGGSEPSYTLPVGTTYKAGGITMLTAAGTPEGVQDVWMTGYLDGVCPPDSDTCGFLGKVSYLAGHAYGVGLPISSNPKTQGARLFLNSLFEAPCATAEGQPKLLLLKEAPEFTADPKVTFVLLYSNGGSGVALDAQLTDLLPAGATFVSASNGGAVANAAVHWSLGNLGANETGAVSFIAQFPTYGTYENTATLDYRVGLNHFSVASNKTVTQYAAQNPQADAAAADGSDQDSVVGGDGSSPPMEVGAEGSGEGAVDAIAADGSGANASDALGPDEGGGCGCRVPQRRRGGPEWSLTLAAAAWLLVRRRSR
jgi:uncharacterized repeat protein (TIGR01451 family)